MGDGLLGFGQPARNGFASGCEGDDLDPIRCAATASRGSFDILVGDAATATRARDGAQVDTQLVC